MLMELLITLSKRLLIDLDFIIGALFGVLSCEKLNFLVFH